MSDQRTAKIGVVGLAHGNGHASGYMKNARSELAAVCDLDEDRLASYKERGVKTYSDFDEMLKHPGLEAVVIATPTTTHVPLAKAAMAAGKHVFLEKPIASSLDEAFELKREKEKYPDLKMQIGFEYQSSPLIQSIKEEIDTGKIGRLHQIIWNTYQPKVYHGAARWKVTRKAGGPLFDESSHFYNVMNYLAQSKFEKVVCFGGIDHYTEPDREVEDNGVLLFEYENKVRVLFGFIEFLDQPCYTQTKIAGSEGKIDVKWEEAGSYKMYTKGYHSTDVDISPQTTSGGHLGFNEQHDRFIDTVLDGKDEFVPLSHGLETYLMGMAALRSIEEERIVYRKELWQD